MILLCFGDTEYRDDNAADSATGGASSNTLIQNLWIEHTKCGMWLDGPFDSYHVVSVTIRNTWADGINFHRGVTNSVIEQTIVRNTGDDGLALWTDSSPDQKNILKFNTISIPVLANGIAFYGGTDNSATDNYIADTICEGGAFEIGNRFQSVPLAGTTILARNSAVRCGSPQRNPSNHNGALWFWAEQAGMDSLINVTELTVTDSTNAGFTFWGSSITNLYFYNVTFNGAPYAMETQGVNGEAFFTDVVAANLAKGGIYSCNPGFVFTKVSGCSGWDDVHCGNNATKHD